jgi:hypothetical protein
LLKKGIVLFFPAEEGPGTMTGKDPGFGRELEQFTQTVV